MISAGPSVVLAGAQLETLEVLVGGLVPGAAGYALPDSPGMRPVLQLPDEGLSPGAVVELRDPQNTPVAELHVSDVVPRSDGGSWVAGEVMGRRPFGHGPARAGRLHSQVDLSGDGVGLFTWPVDLAGLLRLARHPRPTFIGLGRSHAGEDAMLYAALAEAAAELSHARAFFLPDLAGFPDGVDVPGRILAGLGASQFSDVRRPAPPLGDGVVILFTGLSGSGKSTLARELADVLAQRVARAPVLLDGDDVRRELSGELGFTAADRETNLLRQAWVAARVAQGGGVAICAPIAPFAATRARMRERIEPYARLILVHVSTPLHVAEARDRKGLYAKARAGELPDFTGIDSPYEPPEDADVVINSADVTVGEGVRRILHVLQVGDML